MARAHAASRDWPEAAEAWAEILAYRAYPAHVTAKVTVQYSRALRFAGRADQAFDVTSRALSELGPHIGLEREHAENQAALGDFHAASAYWKDLIEAGSAPIFAYQRLAHLYSQEGMLAAALDTLAAGLTSHPQSELLLRS